MRKYIKDALAARKAQRAENGEAGFSLVELIVVVVILGILAAIAIPIFNGLQDQAKTSALESIVGNGASQVASDIAQSVADETIRTNLQDLADQSEQQLTGIKLTVEPEDDDLTIDNYCVVGTATGVTDADGATRFESGPGC